MTWPGGSSLPKFYIILSFNMGFPFSSPPSKLEGLILRITSVFHISTPSNRQHKIRWGTTTKSSENTRKLRGGKKSHKRLKRSEKFFRETFNNGQCILSRINYNYENELLIVSQRRKAHFHTALFMRAVLFSWSAEGTNVLFQPCYSC